MREHTKSFHIRFTEKEYQMLCRRAKQTGLPKSTYIRFMIMGSCPKEHPDDRFHVVMRQLSGICNNAHQIARKANAFGFIDAPMYKREAEKWDKFYLDVYRFFTLPESVDIPDTLERGKILSESEDEI